MVAQWEFLGQMVFGDLVIKIIKKIIELDVPLLFSRGNNNILIDTSPDLRFQLLKNNIKKISSVLYTHFHADQTHGINDLRVFFLNNKKKK